MYLVASFKFEPVTLARLDCIPTRAHGNEKKGNPIIASGGGTNKASYTSAVQIIFGA